MPKNIDLDKRRNPEELLRAVQKNVGEAERGKLRIFLGMCPGVGKTYDMLKAAQEMLASKKRVVVGLVETHGRKDTEKMLEGLPIVEPLQVEYRGGRFRELDLDTLLKLNPIPDAVLIDELAHSNVPGMLHQKRYQDIEELLKMGFNVFTTVNIQHIESRKDTVAQITGITVRETVPDSFFEKADAIEVVDLSPAELLQRLNDGKVYLGDRAERAAQNFFQIEKLSALRELALRFTAEKVDQDLAHHMVLKGIEGPWNINERFLVAISSSPYSSRLLRAARRMAYNLDAPWIAAYVDSGQTLSAVDQKNLQKNLTLAQELGAEVVTVADVNIPNALQKIAADKNVTQIVMGRPDKRFFRDLISGGNMLDQLISSASKVDVHVLRADRPPRYRDFRRFIPQFTTKLSWYFVASAMIAAISSLFYGLLPFFGIRFFSSAFLLVLIVFAAFARRGLVIYSSFSFAFIWFFLFLSPPFSFQGRTVDEWMVVFTYAFTGLFIGWLISRLRKQENFLRKRESRSALLYEFNKRITHADSLLDVQVILSNAVHSMLNCELKVILAGSNGLLDAPSFSSLNMNEKGLANWVYERGAKAGKFTSTLSGQDSVCFPIASDSGVQGVLLIKPTQADYHLEVEDEIFLVNLSNQAGNSLQKMNLEAMAVSNRKLQQRALLNNVIIEVLQNQVKGSISRLVPFLDKLTHLVTNTSEKQQLIEIEQTHKQLHLVADNLICLKRLEQEKVHLNVENIDLVILLQKAINAVVAQNYASLFVVKNAWQGRLLGDQELMLQAMTNLLTPFLHDGHKNSSSEQGCLIRLLPSKLGLNLHFLQTDHQGEKRAVVPSLQPNPVSIGLTVSTDIIALHGGKLFIYRTKKSISFEVFFPSALLVSK